MASLPVDDKEMGMDFEGDYNNENNINPHGSLPQTNSGASKGKLGGGGRISYKECLKNHAANIGGNVTDGCGEFMPSGEDGTLEALKCAACNCHRNFHRKEYHGEATGTPMVHPLQHRIVGGGHWTSMVQPVKMAFAGGGNGGTDSSSEELNFNPYHSGGMSRPASQFATKKRFRTKFTAEQKEKMLEFAEKLGWRIPREDDSEIQRFCAEAGVKRQVFKVWMHNNKSSSKKMPQNEEINQIIN